jgi:hypothetical protein
MTDDGVEKSNEVMISPCPNTHDSKSRGFQGSTFQFGLQGPHRNVMMNFLILFLSNLAHMFHHGLAFEKARKQAHTVKPELFWESIM